MLTNARLKSIKGKWKEGQAIDLAGLLFSEQRVIRISVVIPTLNEEKNLRHILPNIKQWVDEVLIVDGHSKDDTVNVARELCPDVRIIMQQGRGKGDALRAGFAAATGDIIVMLDADGSTDPAEIPIFVGALLSGADFAKGSRFLQGGGTEDMPLYRKLGNWSFVLMVRLLFGGKYTDLCYGYNAFWRGILPVLSLDCNGFEIETLMNVRALKAGLKIIEVPSFEAARIHGNSNLKTIPDGWRVLKTIFREARNRRQQVVPARTPERHKRMTNRMHGIPVTGAIESPSDPASE